MLTDKELDVLQVLELFVVANARQIAILVGNKEETVPRRRVNKLEEEGLIKFVWRDGRKVYFLTQKGLLELEKTRKEYNPVGFSTEHKVFITEAATYIHLTEGIHYYSFAEDKAFKSMDLGHAPDLAWGKNCLEMELNIKSKQRLEKNIRTNASNFEHQIWVVPSRKKSLQASIKTIADKHGIDVAVIPLDEIIKYNKDADLATNDLGKEIELILKKKPTLQEEFE